MLEKEKSQEYRNPEKMRREVNKLSPMVALYEQCTGMMKVS